MEGDLIVLEGVDGAGTTTHTRRLADTLRGQGISVHATREPSDGPVGMLLRQMITRRIVVPGPQGPEAPSSNTMALLFAADRLDHIEAEIVPNLRKGVTVLSDRYVHSSVAYQTLRGGGTQDVAEWVKEINRHARVADLTIVLDIPPEVATQRRRARGGADIFEVDDLQRQLATFYAEIDRHFPGEKIVHVRSDREPDAVAADIARAVAEFRQGRTRS